MLDINLIREDPKGVQEAAARRNNPKAVELVTDVLKHDEEWRALKQEVDKLRHERNTLSVRINEAKKTGKDAGKIILDAKEIPQKLSLAEARMNELQKLINDHLMRIPNILLDEVPDGKSEADNKVLKTYGEKRKFDFTPLSHVDLIEKNKWVDLERAAKISGARWYFLKGDLARLEMALQLHAVDLLRAKKYELVVPPFLMNTEAYSGVTDLGAFSDVLYKIDGEDLHLIATSEHPLTAQFKDEVIQNAELPIKMAGFSTCFRKEAGAHGKDQKGIFRVHQFNKVEQVAISKPEDSKTLHAEMLSNAVEFFESLELPFRTLALCSADTGAVSAYTIDLECWMPAQEAYRECVSCSNCTTYQARRLGIKSEDSPGVNRKYVHTLNSTCVATTRALVAILENYQQKDESIEIPKALQKYCGFKKIGGK